MESSDDPQRGFHRAYQRRDVASAAGYPDRPRPARHRQPNGRREGSKDHGRGPREIGFFFGRRSSHRRPGLKLLSDLAISSCKWTDALEAKAAAGGGNTSPAGSDVEPLLCELRSLESDQTGEQGLELRQSGLGVYVLRKNGHIPACGYTPDPVEVDAIGLAGFHRQGR